MPKPRLIIISGPPASGKTTLAGPLAREMGMPLLAKDRIKERIADAIGPASTDLAGRIGLAAIFTLYDTAHEVLQSGQSVVLESFVHHGKAEGDLAPLVAISRAVLIHVTADSDVLLHRYADRIAGPDRHAIHGDAHWADDLRAYLDNGTTEPLDLAIPKLMLDSTQAFPDPVDVASQLCKLLDGQDMGCSGDGYMQ